MHWLRHLPPPRALPHVRHGPRAQSCEKSLLLGAHVKRRLDQQLPTAYGEGTESSLRGFSVYNITKYNFYIFLQQSIYAGCGEGNLLLLICLLLLLLPVCGLSRGCREQS